MGNKSLLVNPWLGVTTIPRFWRKVTPLVGELNDHDRDLEPFKLLHLLMIFSLHFHVIEFDSSSFNDSCVEPMIMAILGILKCLPLFFKLDMNIVRLNIFFEFILARVQLTINCEEHIPIHLLNNINYIESSFDDDLFISETIIIFYNAGNPSKIESTEDSAKDSVNGNIHFSYRERSKACFQTKESPCVD